MCSSDLIWFYTEDRAIQPYERIREMALCGKEMDGIVCYNDQIAFEVIRALAAEGLKVPEDVSVTGYDNSQMAAGMKLTTIRHPQEKLGETAAELLLSLIKSGDGGEGKHILMEPEIVEGSSCMERNKTK